MDNTSRVAQWRQKMKDEGKEALTVWLSRDVKLRLEDLAAAWRTTTSEMVEQALAQFHPGNPPSIGNDTDTAQIQGLLEDMLEARLPALREQIVQEIRGEMPVAVMNGNGTVTESTEMPSEACPDFDPANSKLGKLCKNGHQWGTTGQSLLRRSNSRCRQCENEGRKEKRAARTQKKTE